MTAWLAGAPLLQNPDSRHRIRQQLTASACESAKNSERQKGADKRQADDLRELPAAISHHGNSRALTARQEQRSIAVRVAAQITSRLAVPRRKLSGIVGTTRPKPRIRRLAPCAPTRSDILSCSPRSPCCERGKPLDVQQPQLRSCAPRGSASSEKDRKRDEAPLRAHGERARARGLSGVASRGRSAPGKLAPPALARTASDDAAFKADLVLLVPHLRAFACSISTRAEGDDLAQQAALKAWNARASFQRGTNLKAWVFTILRNQYMSEKRRSWRSQPLDPTVAENTLVANDDPSASEELLDVRNAMQHLSFEQRQALVLVTAAGLSYEDTAAICGCAVGTVKSRVSRARTELTGLLERRRTKQRARTDVTAFQVFDSIMKDAAAFQANAA